MLPLILSGAGDGSRALSVLNLPRPASYILGAAHLLKASVCTGENQNFISGPSSHPHTTGIHCKPVLLPADREKSRAGIQGDHEVLRKQEVKTL